MSEWLTYKSKWIKFNIPFVQIMTHLANHIEENVWRTSEVKRATMMKPFGKQYETKNGHTYVYIKNQFTIPNQLIFI